LIGNAAGSDLLITLRKASVAVVVAVGHVVNASALSKRSVMSTETGCSSRLTGRDTVLRTLRTDARLKHVLGDAAFILTSKVLAAGAGFAFNVLLARQLGADDYGLFSYVLSLVAVLSLISAFGLNTAAVRFVASYAVEERWALLRGLLRWSTSRVFLLGAVVAGCLMLIAVLPVFAIEEEERRCLLIGGGIVVFGAVVTAQAGVLRGLKHFIVAELAESGGFRSLFSLLAVLIALACDKNIADAGQGIWIAALSTMLVLVLTTITLHRCLPEPARISNRMYSSREWAKTSFPLVLVTAAFMLQTQVDIFMLHHLAPVQDVGIFSAASRISMLVGFGVVSMNAVMAPTIAEMFTLGRREELQKLIYQTSVLTSLAAAAVCLAGALWGRIVLQLFGTEFAGGHRTLLILLVGQCLNALAGNTVFLMSMTGYQAAALRIVIVAVLANIVLNSILIPRLGMEGAAWGSLVATLVWRTTMTSYLIKNTNIRSSAAMVIVDFLRKKVSVW
jgi:O-antigen/teichoic acid export membrane protein